MNNSTLLKPLIVYAICLPLAIYIGYLLANPLDYSTLGVVGVLGFLLIFPILLKWHYPLMLLSWNLSVAGVLFLPGNPSVWLLLVLLSLMLSVLERALNRRKQFLYVPQVAWPLICLIGVIVITAKLTGGFGLRSMGSDVFGGKKYVYLLVGIASFFALTAQSIPRERAKLYVGLFLLGGLTNLIADLFPIAPSWLHFIFWFFPPVAIPEYGIELGVTRLGGVGVAGFALFAWMMANYGIRSLFLSGKKWRLAFFVLAIGLTFMGGFRTMILKIVMVFALQFYMEGLHRTKLLPALTLAGLLGVALLVPFASKLPFTFQRALAFLPLDLGNEARLAAEGTSLWRLEMWQSLLPQIPPHLLLGKGFAISPEDYQMMGVDVSFRALDPSQQGLALSFDYHNGPLSVIIPFGIWGVIAFCWFLGAGAWVVYRNYRYGDPELRIINAFLLASFITDLLVFFFIFGAVSGDIAVFAGLIGLSVGLNGGVCRPVQVPAAAEAQKQSPNFLPRPRSSFQR